MHDPVADVLRQRAALGTGAGAGIAASLVLHGGLIALAIYAALHAAPPTPVTMLNIKLAQAAPVERRPLRPPVVEPPAAEAAVAPQVPPQAIPPPRVEPAKTTPVKPPEKNTVPLSPFGRSTKKGSETPAVEPPAAAPVVPIGGSGVTGLEGGDFPYTLYLEAMQRKIGSNWFRPQIGGGVTVVVYFRIQRDGTITDAEVKTPSGNGTFDRQAVSAIRSSSPLGALPFAFNGTYLGVHMTFR